MATVAEARRWLVEVAGYNPRDDWEAKVEISYVEGDFVELVFTKKDGKTSGCRSRDLEEIGALIIASGPDVRP